MSQHWLSQRERERERERETWQQIRNEKTGGSCRETASQIAIPSILRAAGARRERKALSETMNQLPKSNNEMTHAFGFQGRGY